MLASMVWSATERGELRDQQSHGCRQVVVQYKKMLKEDAPKCHDAGPSPDPLSTPFKSVICPSACLLALTNHMVLRRCFEVERLYLTLSQAFIAGLSRLGFMWKAVSERLVDPCTIVKTLFRNEKKRRIYTFDNVWERCSGLLNF
jgi:hypothetical protein